MAKNNYTTANARRLGYRSGFEEEVAKELDNLTNISYWYEADFCKFIYSTRVINGYCGICDKSPVYQERIYTCDFLIEHGPYDKSMFIETKGRFTAADRSKMLAVIASNPDVDIRILFQYDGKATPKRSYTEWCAWKGIKCAVIDKKNKKYIPSEWLEELGVTDK